MKACPPCPLNGRDDRQENLAVDSVVEFYEASPPDWDGHTVDTETVEHTANAVGVSAEAVPLIQEAAGLILHKECTTSFRG